MCVWVTTGYKEDSGGGRRCACVWVTTGYKEEGGWGRTCVWMGDYGLQRRRGVHVCVGDYGLQRKRGEGGGVHVCVGDYGLQRRQWGREGGMYVCAWRGDVDETEMCEKFSHAHLLGFDACFS